MLCDFIDACFRLVFSAYCDRFSGVVRRYGHGSRPGGERAPARWLPVRPQPRRRGLAPPLQEAVVCLINQQRTHRHLPRLHENQRLNRSAQGWTDVMVRQDDFLSRCGLLGPDQCRRL